MVFRCNCLEHIKHTQLEKYNKATTQEEKDAIEINPYKIIYGAMENAKPLLKLSEMRKGAVLYRVPVPGGRQLIARLSFVINMSPLLCPCHHISFRQCSVTETQQYFTALKWFIEAGRINNLFEDANTPQRLGNEFINAYNNTGKVVRQKQELHKEAEANKAYAHFRWGR